MGVFVPVRIATFQPAQKEMPAAVGAVPKVPNVPRFSQFGAYAFVFCKVPL
jgi:hypothetical protein